MEQVKKEFKIKAQKEPEKHYPVRILKEEGFTRRKCVKCGNYFWSADERSICGEPECTGGYAFIRDSPAREKMDFIETWQKFSKLFKKLGYASIPRYPVVARWRDDADFVQASIYDFQPYVVSGEIEPPANPLVVPQFCLRFNDTDNVGITGRHYTGFVMIGQHAFEVSKKYTPHEYLEHIYIWLTKGMKIPKEELQFHEDAWAGGGNMGPSIEYFSRGLEIGNQVYMQYDVKDGTLKELDIKVLDMGMGQERPAWFTHGTNTSYEVVFPSVVRRLYKVTGVKPDKNLVQKFLPYSGFLSLDGGSLDKLWLDVAEKIGIEVKELKEEIFRLAGIYSICDHTRGLLLALSDGAIPSNVGGGYNLRALLRRSLDFIERYNWDISLPEVCGWHAKYLKPQYPELTENLEEVAEILDAENKKYRETKSKSRRIVEGLKKKEVSLETLIELYDSHGISPEMLKNEGLDVEVPADFYIRVAERHESKHEIQTRRRQLELGVTPGTKILYYDDYSLVKFSAKVLKIIDKKYVILDRTAFYPTSGGQLHDRGYIEGCEVKDVFKQGSTIVHKVVNPAFKEGDSVSCKIDWQRRKQLAQMHTSTHIINGVARKKLGNHIWQAGAEKTLDKARLDITHYESLSPEILNKIEEKANDIVNDNLKVESRIYPREDAEARFGFRLYQGGAVPGKELRVVKIGDLDVEACGGTHLKSTGEAGIIKIVGSQKIQDGVVRLEYVAGEAAERYGRGVQETYRSIVKSLEGLGARVKKIKETNKIIEELEKSAKIFSVPSVQLRATIERFKKEIEMNTRELERLGKKKRRLVIKGRTLPSVSKEMFSFWKEQRKEIKLLSESAAKGKIERIVGTKIGKYELICREIEAGLEETQAAASGLLGKNRIVVLFGLNKSVSVVGMCSRDMPFDMGEIVREVCKILGGGGGGRKEFARGAGTKKKEIKKAKKWVANYIRKAS